MLGDIISLKSTKNRIMKKGLVIICFLLLSIALFMGKQLYVFGGLVIGSIFGYSRFCAMANMCLSVQMDKNNKTRFGISIIRYVVVVLATLFLVVVALWKSKYVFFGVIIGVLIIPLVIFIEGLKETLPLIKMAICPENAGRERLDGKGK